MALEARGQADRAQAAGQQHGHGAGDGQGDPGGGLRCPARRGGRYDTDEAGGEELARGTGARGRAVAGDVLPGGVAMGQRFGSVRIGVKDVPARWLKASRALEERRTRFTDKSWRRLSYDILNTFSS